MGRWTSEKSGFDVLRSLAEKAFEKHETRGRIWSESMEAWGYFAEALPTDVDQFLLWCLIKPGDRLVVRTNDHVETMLVLSTDVDVIQGNVIRMIRFIDHNCVAYTWMRPEKSLFQTGWKCMMS